MRILAAATLLLASLTCVAGQNRLTTLPVVPLSKVHISLERTICMGACPAYRVDIYGDGRVTYQGKAFVDVKGSHSYKVDAHAVEGLVDNIRSKNIWSMQSYGEAPPDTPGCHVTINMGKAAHRLACGMGPANLVARMSGIVNKIENIAHTDMWINLSADTLAQLKAEHFDFQSDAAADMLYRAVANRDTSDSGAMLELMRFGAPLNVQEISGNVFEEMDGSLLDRALLAQRANLVDPLIAAGFLNTNGISDQEKINSAFRSAIAGGRFDLVKKIWQISGSQVHPSMTFGADPNDTGPKQVQKPVTLLLRRSFVKDEAWDGLEIASWLVSMGCDIHAATTDGMTLLQIAADAHDAKFVQYLLKAGLSASEPGRNGQSIIAATWDEDVVMVLLEAGAYSSQSAADRDYLRNTAASNHWARVNAWLKKNG